MIYDTIDFEIVKQENHNYPIGLENWEASEDRDYDDPPSKYWYTHELIINGKIAKHYTDLKELLRCTTQKDCYTYYFSKEGTYEQDHSRSMFEPFTCSCGDSGCAGIWDGVHLKVRGHSVEWKVKKDCGYDFLEKRLYNFNKKDYYAMLDRLKQEIELCQ